ncbi:MAG TPA: serine/threonine-protein kinase, partial [Solirubrobacteraceae bacterium]|nr:serine/threonine-protein kinase [Solirubrobacteraceae bacterium]
MTRAGGVRMDVDLAGYRIDSVIGHGGMATVYRAEHLRLGREVALKILAPELAHDAKFRGRFLDESRIAAQLDHPSVVPVYDAGEADGVLYIAMRLVPGSDLRALVRAEGRLPVELAQSVLAQLAGALHTAHELGLVHRDVKPANTLIETGGEGDGQLRAYLSDFGLARTLSAPEQAGTSLGSVPYMSPEHIRGEREDARSDVYSLGCLMYECLTGEPPFVRESAVETCYAHLRAPVPRVSQRVEGIPPPLDDAIAAAMAKAPSERPESALAFARAAAADQQRAAPLAAASAAARSSRPGQEVVG